MNEKNPMKKSSTAPVWSDCPFIDFPCEVDRLLYERDGIESVDLDAVTAAQEAGETPQELVACLRSAMPPTLAGEKRPVM